MTEGIKPCPFCGGSASHCCGDLDEPIVKCNRCTARADDASDWNTRPDQWVMTSDKLPEEGVPVWGEMDRQEHVLAIYVLLQSEWLFTKGTIFVENGRWFNLMTCKDKPENPPKRWRYML